MFYKNINIKLIFIFIITIITSSYIIYKYYIDLTHKPLLNQQDYILEILPKQTFSTILKQLTRDLVLSTANKNILYFLAKLKKYDRNIQAGEYLIIPGTTALQLLEQLTQGKVLLHKFTIVEGTRFEQIVDILQHHPKIQKTLNNYSCASILQAINRTNILSCEGLFLADTYLFAKNTKDILLLQEAYDAMHHKLQSLWNNSNVKQISKSLKSSYDALILASIIEKETSIIQEMPRVSGVYHRRLQLGMLLQADPTVMYGLNIIDRPLTLTDLKTHSSYNTYLNKGLPPTPIATPSSSAILAALHPDYDDNSLYFVADGRGGHVFSASLAEHNKAVAAFRSNRNNH